MRISSSYAPRMRRWRRLMPSLSKPRDSYKRRALPFEPKTESSAFLKPRTRIHSRIRSIRMRPRPTSRHPSRIAIPIPPTWRVFAYLPPWQSAEPIDSPSASATKRTDRTPSKVPSHCRSSSRFGPTSSMRMKTPSRPMRFTLRRSDSASLRRAGRTTTFRPSLRVTTSALIGSAMASQRELVEHLRPAALAARKERIHLLLQLGRQLRVDVGEEGFDRRWRASLDLLDRRLEEVFELDPELVFGILRPQSLELEVLPHPFDRIALRPGVDFVLRAIARRIIAR